jgi:DNA-binding GntR family transcriptional regulator
MRVPAEYGGVESPNVAGAAVTELSFDLDRSSPVPLYYQISLQIEEAIERGDLPAGSRLENEASLAQRWGLSRPTMRRAIQELVDKGLVVRKRGIGTQVVGHGQVKRQLQLTSLYDDLVRSGQKPTTTVLVREVTPADEVVAGKLAIAAGDDVVHIKRLRFADGEPLAFLRNWLPLEVAADYTAEQLEAGGLYALFRGSGINTRIASQRIGACVATSQEARPLGVRRGAALLTAERVTYDDNGRVVEYGRHLYRADMYSFEVMIVER